MSQTSRSNLDVAAADPAVAGRTAALRFDFPHNSFNLASMNLTEQMTRLAKQAKAASRELAKLTTAEKNVCLLAMATALEQNAAAIKLMPPSQLSGIRLL